MQLGFAMLEVGGVREAHRMTVLAKNLGETLGLGPGQVKLGKQGKFQKQFLQHLQLALVLYCFVMSFAGSYDSIFFGGKLFDQGTLWIL